MVLGPSHKFGGKPWQVKTKAQASWTRLHLFVYIDSLLELLELVDFIRFGFGPVFFAVFHNSLLTDPLR